jgi:hypothetical protein
MLNRYGGMPLRCRDMTPSQYYDTTELRHGDGATPEQPDIAAPQPHSATMARHCECKTLWRLEIKASRCCDGGTL